MNKIITVIILFLLIGTTLVHTQEAGMEWEMLNQEVIDLYRAGKYEHAVVIAKKALEVAEKNVDPNYPGVVTSLSNLAGIYVAQGQYAQAEPLYKRSLAICEKALGPNHPDVARNLENLAFLYRTTKQEMEADKFKARAARIRAIKR